jgi:hypothetical protein
VVSRCLRTGDKAEEPGLRQGASAGPTAQRKFQSAVLNAFSGIAQAIGETIGADDSSGEATPH